MRGQTIWAGTRVGFGFNPAGDANRGEVHGQSDSTRNMSYENKIKSQKRIWSRIWSRWGWNLAPVNTFVSSVRIQNSNAWQETKHVLLSFMPSTEPCSTTTSPLLPQMSLRSVTLSSDKWRCLRCNFPSYFETNILVESESATGSVSDRRISKSLHEMGPNKM